MVAEEKSIMDWSTMFLTFLVGSSFTLVAVLALVLKTVTTAPEQPSSIATCRVGSI